ncbi:MAG: hypothetical protein H6733_13650 [Alphaproteobacteria bacterium]|nr:hypothetical protein [Alphaproteobacteria bacterium]
MRALVVVFALAACRTGAVGSAPNATLVVRASGAQGLVEVVEELPIDAVRRVDDAFRSAPFPVGEPTDVRLPDGWLVLRAQGEPTPHPGCPDDDDTDASTPYEDGWSAQVQVWVSDDPVPDDGPRITVAPDGPPTRIEIALSPQCGCCLD